jgi:pyruvate,water dikinase
MKSRDAELSTGLPSLDDVLQGLRPGDNVVWQVGDVQDYEPFVQAFHAEALRRGKQPIYFRFARHAELLPSAAGVEIHRLRPEHGFESFTTEIHRVIARAGRGAFYVFDCLSDLAGDWYSDLMLGNFFMLTCPYLFELDTVTYFALLRRRHSFHAVASIRETTQLLLDVHRHEGRIYVQPLKAWERYAPTMYLPHAWGDDGFRPVTESAAISGIYSTLAATGTHSATGALDLWDRIFHEAQQVLEDLSSGARGSEKEQELFKRLARMVISRDERMLDLIARYLTLEDLLDVRRRMIGTGLIGGKSVGMLLARAILRNVDPRLYGVLEAHDSFYVGADVFYSYLVKNGCWRMRQRQRDPSVFLDEVETARQKMLQGSFPDFVRQQFAEMLEYFGQSPIVVRSSSLLEDSFGNAFSGKYESVFCVNQGAPQERLDAFLAAVRRIYAAAMGRDALLYRERCGLLDCDEQMALLVQRVSGAIYGNLFFPQVSGVGLSFNPFVWSDQIDPEAGALRLVFGLGTRAVRRADDDYTRIVALNAPTSRPEAGLSEARNYAQWRVDVLDLGSRQLTTRDFEEVARCSPILPLDLVASRDVEMLRRAREQGRHDVFPWVLTFDKLLTATPFVRDVRAMLHALQTAYEYPVDVELTANRLEDESYRINLVQCRPFQVRGGGPAVSLPEAVAADDLVFEARGAVIGRSVSSIVGRLIYVVPRIYGQLSQSDRYSIARLIGRLTRLGVPPEDGVVMLLGPGRWGSTSPFLGVPVSFAEISKVSVLCEIVEMREGLVPDVSLGTHFFNDLVEMEILYTALFPDRPGHAINSRLLEEARNRLATLLSDESCWADAVRVVEAKDLPGGRTLRLDANVLQRRVVCHLTHET